MRVCRHIVLVFKLDSWNSGEKSAGVINCEAVCIEIYLKSWNWMKLLKEKVYLEKKRTGGECRN